MPNDVPDWTGLNKANLVGGLSGVNLGDVSAPSLNADSVTETITTFGGPLGQVFSALASFKAAAGSTIAKVGSLGAVKVGTATAVAPTFGQPTTAGNLLVAWVSGDVAGAADIVVTGAGWVEDQSTQNECHIFFRPNCGGAEAPPTFSIASAGTGPMFAMLGEFSGAATVSPLDKNKLQTDAGSTTTVSNPGVDAAFGDLVLLATRWYLSSAATATFSDAYNNGSTAVQAGTTGSASSVQQSNFSYAIVPAATVAQPLGVAPWVYDAVGTSTPASGGAPSIVFPATPGKAYILARLGADLRSDAGVADGAYIQVLDGVNVVWNRLISVPATARAIDHVTEPDLAIKGTAGNSMTVKFASIGAGSTGALSAAAYLR